jgi:sugar lactone lactonase YvrE
MSIRLRTLLCAAAAAGVLCVAGASAADGPITTFAGTVGGFGDGEATTVAKLDQPEGIGLSANGGTVLIADTHNHRIRKLDLATKIVTTVAGDGVADLLGDGGPAGGASLNTPTDVAFAVDGGYFIADSLNHRIRRVAPDGTISTYAGSVQGLQGDGGPARLARLDTPRELAVIGDVLLVADAGNHRIRRIDANGFISTVAGTSAGFSGDGGPAVNARLNNPRGVTATSDGGFLIADAGNNRIRKVDAAGTISTVGGGSSGFGGDGGFATDARLSNPSDVVEIANGGFIVADTANNRIRRVTPLGAIFTVAGGSAGLAGDGGPASAGRLNTPNALQFAPSGGMLVGDTANHRIRKLGDVGQVPDPELVRSIGVTPVGGRVTVKPRTRSAFIPLRERDLTPNISDIDAIGGELDVTVRNRSGALRTVNASRGSFRITQPTSGPIIGDLKLNEKLDGCRGAKTISTHAATPKKKVRRLRVRVKGRFRTTGRYASAIARGTAWTITDRCDRTLIRVTEGTVIVRILRTGRSIKVRAGQRRTILARSR